MKKIILLSSLLLLAMSVHSQKMDFWLDTGLKVQSGFTALYNSNAQGDAKWDLAIAKGTKYGAKFGFNFNYSGISLDIMTGKLRGEYQYLGDPAISEVDYDTEITVQSTDIYLLFRNAKNKGYFEIGPKISFVSDVDVVYSIERTGPADVKDSYETMPLGAVLGFGTYILGPPDGRFSGIFGLRFEYGFQDAVSDAGRTAGESRQPVNYAGESGPTNPFFAGIVFELNWGIGGVGQARCGERSKFIWF